MSRKSDFSLHFRTAKNTAEAAGEAPPCVAEGMLSRVSRHLALAIRIDRTIRGGPGYAELARVGRFRG